MKNDRNNTSSRGCIFLLFPPVLIFIVLQSVLPLSWDWITKLFLEIVGSVFGSIVVLLLSGKFSEKYPVFDKPKVVRIVNIMMSILVILAIGLEVTYVIKKEDVKVSNVSGETISLRVHMTPSFSSGVVGGSVYNPSVHLKVNEKLYTDSQVLKLEFGQTYNAEIHVSDGGHNNYSTQFVSAHKTFPLTVNVIPYTKTVDIEGQGMVNASVKLSFNQVLSFWDVILH